MRTNRHAFIRGCFDSKERDIEDVYDEYREAGFEEVELITVETRRRRLPEPQYIDRAIRYLDGDAIEVTE